MKKNVKALVREKFPGAFCKPTEKGYVVFHNDTVMSSPRGCPRVAWEEVYIDRLKPTELELTKLRRRTNRKDEIMDLVAQGYEHKEISARLFIGRPTVTTHIMTLKKEYGARNTKHLLKLWLEEKWRRE